jgi:diaminopropionate ammonia-lyase
VTASHLNTRARDGALSPFDANDYQDLAGFYARHPHLDATPLVSLPALAGALGVGAVHVKDESTRFGLNAFKSLGVRYAVDRLERDGTIDHAATLVCASAGNHGRAVARAARERGLRARVYMSSDATDAVRRNIASEGAEVVVVNGTYDAAVRAMARDAKRHGWTIVSDTSWPGYDAIPRLIMLGYTRIVREMAEQLGGTPDVVFAQGGVGGLICGVAAGLLDQWPRGRPRLVACEPIGAACLLASARAGRVATLEGPLRTIMAGLRCAEPSPAAWPTIAAAADAFVAVDDHAVMDAMRMLARPMAADPAIESGPSGACGLASFVAVMRDAELRSVRDALALGPASRVVVINSEGATDPELYQRIVGGP